MGRPILGRIKPAIARKVICDHHYSHAWPTGNFLSFGIFIDKEMLGVITFGHPANSSNWKSIPGMSKSRDLIELTRLWIADRAPSMCESSSIATALQAIRTAGIARCVVSYADPMQGHVGTIYQASNWVYVGQTAPGRMFRMPDGSLLHTRAAFDKFGTSNLAKLAPMIPGIASAKVPGKHKYLYPLDKGMRRALRQIGKPYPVRSPNGGAPVPAGERQFDPDLGA